MFRNVANSANSANTLMVYLHFIHTSKMEWQIDRECPHPSSRPSDFHHGFCLNCFEHNFPLLKKSRTLKNKNTKK